MIGSSAFLSIPAARFAILYRPSLLQRLIRRTSYELAFRLIVLSEKVPASDPLVAQLGRVVADGDCVSTARSLLTSASRGDATAVAHSKRLLRELLDGQFDAPHWDEVARQLSASPARLEAVREVRRQRSHSTKQWR